MKPIPFLDVGALNAKVRHALDDAYRRVMASGWFILGPEVEAFEHEFAEYCGTACCVGVANGLDALSLLLRAYGVGPGDEVIVPSNTFIATWLAVTYCGANPVPAEPNDDTCNLDPASVEAAISPRTRAIIPVHLYGQPADMEPINRIAARHGLLVVEDAAQAHGARYKGRRAGSLAHAAATSFYPGKNLGALGDGGAVLTDDREIADKVRRLRNYGSATKYVHELAGCNSRLDELQAAFLRAKLAVLDEWNVSRTAIAARYTAGLASSDVILPRVAVDTEPVWHLYVVRSSARDELRAHLDRAGVGTGVHYPRPPHRQVCFSSLGPFHLPIAERQAQEVLSLPMSPLMTTDDADRVVELIGQFARGTCGFASTR